MHTLLNLLFFSATSFAQPAPIPTPSDIALQMVVQSLQFTQNSEAQVTHVQVTLQGDRELHEITLSTPHSGDAQILISGPRGFKVAGHPFTTLFMSAGFMSGKGTVNLVSEPGDNILVGFQYPYNKQQIQSDPSLLYKSMHLVPGQMALAISWLSKQSFVDPKRFHVMGVSLGSLLLPVVLKLNQIQGVVPSSTLLCFGGSEFGMVFDHVLKDLVKDKLVRGALVNGLSNLLSPYNPKLYLPSLQGPFFTVYAEEDQIFSKAVSEEQFALLPESKEIHWITGPHIDVDQPEQIAKTMALVKEFISRF